MAIPLNRRRVTFAQKAYSRNPHECIDSIGGLNSDKSRWKLSQEAAIVAIESANAEFFLIADDRSIKVVVATHAGQKYLQTEPNEQGHNALLDLPSS